VGEINLPRTEREALKAIDIDELDALVRRSIDERHASSLQTLRLGSCGQYASSRLHAFEQALVTYRAAKAPKKLSETESHVRRAGSDLVYAVRQMRDRAETEEKEDQVFRIDDEILPPFRLSDHLAVRVSYRWRSTVDDEWEHGSITFTHDVDLRPDYSRPVPKRKPSASKQEQDRQDNLYREWEILMRSALYSVRDFFRSGGNAAAIPGTFQAIVDSHTRALNNFSTQFWLVHS